MGATEHVAKVSVCHTSDCPSFDKVTDSTDEVGVHCETYLVVDGIKMADRKSTIEASLCIRKTDVNVSKEEDNVLSEVPHECTLG